MSVTAIVPILVGVNGPWAQSILGVLLIVLAIVLVIEGVQTLKKPKKANA